MILGVRAVIQSVDHGGHEMGKLKMLTKNYILKEVIKSILLKLRPWELLNHKIVLAQSTNEIVLINHKVFLAL